MEYEKTIKDAEELALTLILKKARKSVGIYYFMWGFYDLYTTLAFIILYNLNFENALTDFLAILPFIIPLYYTAKFLRDINWEYAVFEHKIKNLELEKAKKRINIGFTISIIFSLLSVLVFLIIIPNITTNRIIALGSVYVFVGFIIYSLYLMLYSKHRLVEPRYYDLLALVSFPFEGLVTSGSVPSIIGFSISILVAMAWLYAGFRSILEVSEIE